MASSEDRADAATGAPGDPTVETRALEGAHTAATVMDRPTPVPPTTEMERGTILGRYVVIGRVGSGGIGVVYRAYDPELDRAVALKVIRVERIRRGKASSARTRLLREAQALAKLSHPNVVEVYDVGVAEDGQVFVAMALAEGQTLDQWLEERPRSRAEILRVFQAAGQGLAAAHEAGLVHRDFKPSNVLVGSDGRVRVLDFGLARAAADEPWADSETDDELSESGLSRSGELLHTPLTRTGAVVGTPRYMAPEQHERRTADERSDQFSFCVALYEALYGRRPFTGVTYEELASAVLRGRVDDRPGDARVPRWLRRVLVRGLSVDPDDRYPSMRSLLAAIAADPWVRRRRIAAVLALVAGIGGAIVASRAAVDDRAGLCTGAEAELAGIWDDERRGALETAFGQVAGERSGDLLGPVTAALDDYADEWVSARTRACRATRVQGIATEHTLERRSQCLVQRLGAFRTLVEVMATDMDRTMAFGAAKSIFGLPSPEQCLDEVALSAEVPPPSEPERRDAVERVRSLLGEAQGLSLAGKYEAALTRSERALERAGEVGYRPALADAHLELAILSRDMNRAEESEKHAREAAFEAAAAGYDTAVADALMELANSLGYWQAETDEGLAMIEMAELAVVRAGNQPLQRAWLHSIEAAIHHNAGDREQALEESLESLAIVESADEARWPSRVSAHGNVAYELVSLGRCEEAVDHLEEVYQVQNERAGPLYPQGAITRNLLASCYLEEGREEAAARLYREAFEIRRAVYGDEHPMVANSLSLLGSYYAHVADFERALDHHRRAVEMSEATRGPEHPLTLEIAIEAGTAAAGAGRPAEALRLCERALAGEGLDDNVRVAAALCAARAELASGKPAAAREVLAPVCPEADPEGFPELVAECRFTTGRALFESGRDRARGLELARSALDEYPERNRADARTRERMKRWLDDR